MEGGHRSDSLKIHCTMEQEAQLSLTNCATLFCKVVEVLQDFLSEHVDKKFTTDYNVAYVANVPVQMKVE